MKVKDRVHLFSMFLLGLSLTTTGLVGCSDDDDPVTKQSAYLRVLHLSPDAPAVDVFADGNVRVVQNLAFLDSTEYLEVDAGVYDFQITASGNAATESVLEINDLMLSAGKYYTAVAFDVLENIQALAMEDKTDGLATDMIRVRAIHAAFSVGQVDIWNIPGDRDSGEPTLLYENVDFGVVGAYMDLPAQAYTLGFDIDDDANPDVIFSLPALPAGTVANVFAVNDSQGAVILNAQLQDSTTARIEAMPIEPGETEIRLIHLSPDAPLVDIWVNSSMKAVSDLEFGQGTAYLTLDAGTYDVSIAPAGSSASQSVLDIKDLLLEADKRYTAVAYDSLASIKAIALEDDFTGLAVDQIRVRPIHTAMGVGPVDIWNLPAQAAPTLLFEDLDFGAAGDYLDLPANAYTLGFDVNKDAVPDAIFEIPALAAGTIANVFAVANTRGGLSLRAQSNLGAVATIPASIAQVRVLHISPDAPAVDVLINDNPDPAVQELSFGQATDYLEVIPGEYNFYITETGKGSTDAVLSLSGFNLMKSKFYTAVAFDKLEFIRYLWLEDDYLELAENNIRVRAIHASPVIGQVDIWALFDDADPQLLYEDVDFGIAGTTLDLPADAYRLGFDVNNDKDPDVVYQLPALPAGTVANLFATNAKSGSVFPWPSSETGQPQQSNPNNTN